MSKMGVLPHGEDHGLVVVTIPLYKAAPTNTEIAALKQVFKTLVNHPVCLFTFRELDLTVYAQILEGFNYQVTFFDRKYFRNIAGYNQLLCHPAFYRRFNKFSYLLIYQLDAWVFRDELAYWCETGYDYIGAPWFEATNQASVLPPFLGVGNGGFSLRKVSSHIKVLNKLAYIRSPRELWTRFIKKTGRHSLKEMLSGVTIDNNTHYLLRKLGMNEDVFWGTITQKGHNWFCAPGMLESARFSMEVHADLLVGLVGSLPFGCHAWEKYHPLFWSKFIPNEHDL